jgi:hypothetical protein
MGTITCSLGTNTAAMSASVELSRTRFPRDWPGRQSGIEAEWAGRSCAGGALCARRDDETNESLKGVPIVRR